MGDEKGFYSITERQMWGDLMLGFNRKLLLAEKRLPLVPSKEDLTAFVLVGNEDKSKLWN